MRRRPLVWGAAAAALYVGTAIAFVGDGPVLPLYEGNFVDVPYRWVDPPPEFAAGNVAPEGTTQEVALIEAGSVAASVLTPDGQAAVVFREGSIAPRLGETAVVVSVDPVDPDALGDPPDGLRYDGNAYRMTATYPREDAPAELVGPATVVLRAPLGGTRLLRRDGAAGWTPVGAEPVAASLQVFGEVNELGVFVAAHTVRDAPFPWLWVSLGASAVAVGAAWLAAGRARKRKLSRMARRDRRRAARSGKPDAATRRPPPRKRPKRR